MQGYWYMQAIDVIQHAHIWSQPEFIWRYILYILDAIPVELW